MEPEKVSLAGGVMDAGGEASEGVWRGCETTSVFPTSARHGDILADYARLGVQQAGGEPPHPACRS